jgi:hypothetical protein
MAGSLWACRGWPRRRHRTATGYTRAAPGTSSALLAVARGSARADSPALRSATGEIIPRYRRGGGSSVRRSGRELCPEYEAAGGGAEAVEPPWPPRELDQDGRPEWPHVDAGARRRCSSRFRFRERLDAVLLAGGLSLACCPDRSPLSSPVWWHAGRARRQASVQMEDACDGQTANPRVRPAVQAGSLGRRPSEGVRVR